MRLRLVLLFGFLSGMVGSAELARGDCETYKVRIFTPTHPGLKALLLLELTSSADSMEAGGLDFVRIADFQTDGKEAPGVRTFGGPVDGRLVHPGAPPSDSWIYGGGGLVNGVGVSFDSLGTHMGFDLELMSPIGSPDHPSRFAMYLTGFTGVHPFPTADPTGANALFIVSGTGDCEELTVYSPLRFAFPDSILFDTSGWTGVADGERGEAVLDLARVGPNPARSMCTFEFSAPAGPVSLRIFDLQGRVVFVTRSEVARDSGTSRLGWSLTDSGGNRVAPGVYFAELANRQKTIVRKIVVDR